jgi:hypothetical protein
MLEARRIATLSVAVSLALPAGAFAQGAGETQYGDPFEGEQRAQRGTGSGNQSGGGGGGGGRELSTTAPSGTTTETRAAQTRTPSGELARTGAEPGLIALLGMGLLMTGAGLRVRVRRPLA